MSFGKVRLIVTVTLLITLLVKGKGEERKGKAFASYTSVHMHTPYQSYSYTFNTKHGNSYTQIAPYKMISNHQTPFVQSKPVIKPHRFQNQHTFATQHVQTPLDWSKTYGYKPANVNLPVKSFLTRPAQASQPKGIDKLNRRPIPVKIFTARPVQIKKNFTRPFQTSQLKRTNKPTKILIPVTGKKVTAKPVQIKKIEEETEEDDLVLDFSSGTAQVVENTATKIEELSEEETVKAAGGAFSKFRELIAKVDIVKEVEDAGNVTIFTPFNKAFDKLPTKLEDLPLSTQRKLVLKHFVKGFLLKKDMKNGPIQTLGGEFITIAKNPDTNKVKIFSQSGQSNIKVSNVKTKFGLVNIIDTVLT